MGPFKIMNLEIKEYSCLEVRFGTKLKTHNEEEKEKSNENFTTERNINRISSKLSLNELSRMKRSGERTGALEDRIEITQSKPEEIQTETNNEQSLSYL